MHLACAAGHLPVARVLMRANPELLLYREDVVSTRVASLSNHLAECVPQDDSISPVISDCVPLGDTVTDSECLLNACAARAHAAARRRCGGQGRVRQVGAGGGGT